MILIAGLGNPGKKYSKTRHNAGFEFLEYYKKSNYFPSFCFVDKFSSFVSEKDKTYLVLPQLFMNNSGKTISSIKNFYKLNSENIIIVHDDIDIELGDVRLSKDSSSAGHNGIKSIINNLGTKDFYRVRIGIKPDKKSANIEKFVLKRFSKKEHQLIEESFMKAESIINELLTNLKKI
jgi:peptidyl-tRNA hydrolase, PTH1 family